MPNLKLPARASLKSRSKSYPILNVKSIDWNPIKKKNELGFSSKCRVSGGGNPARKCTTWHGSLSTT